jgi:hypothetical protein
LNLPGTTIGTTSDAPPPPTLRPPVAVKPPGVDVAEYETIGVARPVVVGG